jgi:hypothetical protein
LGGGEMKVTSYEISKQLAEVGFSKKVGFLEYYYNTDKELRHRDQKNYYHDERYFVAQILQTKIGLGIAVWYTTLFIPQGFGRWILMGFEMLRIFIKREHSE